MRAFVATARDKELIVDILEQHGIEVIPQTDDSIIDNLESLQTCSLIVVDSATSDWVLREIQDHKKFAVSYITSPNTPVVCHVVSPQQFSMFLDESKGMYGMVPVTEEYVKRLGAIKLRFRPQVMESV